MREQTADGMREYHGISGQYFRKGDEAATKQERCRGDFISAAREALREMEATYAAREALREMEATFAARKALREMKATYAARKALREMKRGVLFM